MYAIPQIMKYIQNKKSLFLSLIILVFFASCSKDEIHSGNQSAGITVKLKSTVGEFDKVYLEIEDVQLRVKEDTNASNAWISLNTINIGTYNIYDLRDDSELLLVDHFEMNPKYIYEIRLVLGENNFIDINNNLISFDVVSLDSLKPTNLVELDVAANHIYDFIIDINVDNSISFNEAQNSMVLNPEIYTEVRKF